MNDGWGFVGLRSGLCHYFSRGMSLCGRITITGREIELEPNRGRSKYDCRDCRRLLKRYEEEENYPEPDGYRYGDGGRIIPTTS